jgi:hypothetical protein
MSMMRGCGRAARHGSFACIMAQKFCTRPIPKVSTSFVLDRLDAAIEANNTQVNNLLSEYKNDIKKVQSKFDISDKKMRKDVTLKRKKVKNGEALELKFDCTAEVIDFDDDDGYDRILQLLERAEEKNLDYSDKTALGEEKEGIEVDVHINKRGGRLTFNCIASDKIVIQKVYFDSPLSLTGDAKELKRLYSGPKYVNLDEPMRDALQHYLKKRLVDDFLSSFIFNYSRIKRGKEFSHWAEHMKTIITS